MTSLLFLIGLALAVAGIIILTGRVISLFFIPFDWFGAMHYFLIFVGLFLIVLDRISKQKPGEGFWKMKYERV